MYYRLTRQEDGLMKESKDIKWIEFDEQGRFKKAYKTPKKGRSLLMSPLMFFYLADNRCCKSNRKNRNDGSFQNQKFRV